MAERRASFSDSVREVVQALIDLARAEISALTADLEEQARQAARVGLLLVVASVFVFWAVGSLLAGSVLVLALWLDPWVAALVLGVLLLLIAGIFLWLARARMRHLDTPANLTRQHLQDTANWWEREFGKPRGPEAARLERDGLGRAVDGASGPLAAAGVADAPRGEATDPSEQDPLDPEEPAGLEDDRP